MIFQDICHGWLRFEREHGTLEDFDHAVQKVLILVTVIGNFYQMVNIDKFCCFGFFANCDVINTSTSICYIKNSFMFTALAWLPNFSFPIFDF